MSCRQSLRPTGPTFEVIVDAVGGPVLGAALQRVAPHGTVVSFAATTTEPVSYPTRALFGRAHGATLHGLYIFDELEHTRTGSADLRRLADLIAAGRLDPQIAITASWTRRGDRDRGAARPARQRQGRPDTRLTLVDGPQWGYGTTQAHRSRLDRRSPRLH